MLHILARAKQAPAVRAAQLRGHSRTIMTRLHAHAGAAAAAAAPSSAAPARAFPLFTPSRSFAKSSRNDDMMDFDMGEDAAAATTGTGAVGEALSAEEQAELIRAYDEALLTSEMEESQLPADDPSAFPEGTFRHELAEDLAQERKELERELEDWDQLRDGPRPLATPTPLFDNSTVGRIRRGVPAREGEELEDDLGIDEDEVDAASAEEEGRDDDVFDDVNDEADEVEEADPTHVANGRTVFEHTRVDHLGNKVKVFVDRTAKPLRHFEEYQGFEREEGQEFPGFVVEIKQNDTVEEDMTGMKFQKEDDEIDEPQPQGTDLEYDVENDPDHHWQVHQPLDTFNPRDNETEWVMGAGDGGKLRPFQVDGDEVPGTVWQGRQWLTFPRTWDDIRKNGRNPSIAEVEAHIKTILGSPRPPIPINPEWQPQAQEYVWAPNLGQTDETLLMSDAEWDRKYNAEHRPRSWFVEARLQYKRKLNLVRSKYLREYQVVKRMHDANIQARWDQQMENRRAKNELRARTAAASLLKNRAFQARMAERRRRIRIKSRFTRMNKEMKYRRLQLHMINYMLKEREMHWIQPKLDAKSGQYIPNKNLSTKLFEKDSYAVGFWPKHPLDERKERMDEMYRRKMAKQMQ